MYGHEGQHRLKNEFTYCRSTTLLILYPKWFSLLLAVKTTLKLKMEHSVKFQIYRKLKKEIAIVAHILQINILNFGYFTILFCKRRYRNVPRLLTQVHSHCNALQTICSVAFMYPLWFCYNSLWSIPMYPMRSKEIQERAGVGLHCLK